MLTRLPSSARLPLTNQTGRAEFKTVEKVNFKEMGTCRIASVLNRGRKGRKGKKKKTQIWMEGL